MQVLSYTKNPKYIFIVWKCELLLVITYKQMYYVVHSNINLKIKHYSIIGTFKLQWLSHVYA